MEQSELQSLSHKFFPEFKFLLDAELRTKNRTKLHFTKLENFRHQDLLCLPGTFPARNELSLCKPSSKGQGQPWKNLFLALHQ